MTRLDRRGRRIGHNWWRAFIMDHLTAARQAWDLQAEAASNGWATELAEWRELHPQPQLKAFLVGLAGERP